MTFSCPAAQGDVSAVMAAIAAPAFLRNQMNSFSYLIVRTEIISAGKDWL
jgi:hypothetical protein